MAESKFVVFRLAEEWYGVPIESVERILEDQEVTRLPRLPKVFLGVFDLRGQTMPALDLRERFALGSSSKPGSMVVVLLEGGRCAWRVDSVVGIFSLDESQIEESPEMIRAADDDFLAGVGRHGEKLIVLVNPENVLPQSARKALAAAA